MSRSTDTAPHPPDQLDPPDLRGSRFGFFVVVFVVVAVVVVVVVVVVN